VSSLVSLTRWRDPNEEPPPRHAYGPGGKGDLLVLVIDAMDLSLRTARAGIVTDAPGFYRAWAPLPVLNPDGATTEDIEEVVDEAASTQLADPMTRDREWPALDRLRRLLEDS